MLPEEYPRSGSLFPPSTDFGTPEEPPDATTAWTVPDKQLSTDHQRAARFSDGSSKGNGQHPAWMVTI